MLIGSANASDVEFIKFENQKNQITDMHSAINYIIAEAQKSSYDSFITLYGSKATISQDKEDIIKTLNWYKEKKIDRYSLYAIVNALKDGVMHPSCNINGKLDHDCGNYDKEFHFRPHLRGALEVSRYADKHNLNSSLLAEHYEIGWVIEKNLIKAYDLYMKDKDQNSDHYLTDINLMIQHELVFLGEDISIDGDFGRNSCEALKKHIGETQCTNTVSRVQVEKLWQKVLKKKK